MVGSKDSTDQLVLGEIVAQHVEHRLGRKVVRNLGLGNTAVAYQALLNGQIGIYPEETGTIQAKILKESPSLSAATTLERVRNEMRRVAQADVLDPLGMDNGWAIVVKKDDAAQNKIETLSDAASIARLDGTRRNARFQRASRRAVRTQSISPADGRDDLRRRSSLLI